MKAKALKPCPFCGVLPRVRVTRYVKLLKLPPVWWVRCKNTNCAADPRVQADSRAEVVRRWNQRAPEAQEVVA